MNTFTYVPGIDVGGGWRTLCGSHPHSAKLVGEPEQSVWSVVRQNNGREDQLNTGSGVRPSTGQRHGH